MVKKFIAVSMKGKEFMFDKTRMIGVPEGSARKIADELNRQKYKLKKDDEVWYPHDNDWYYNGFIDSEIRRYGNRMPIYKYYG